MWLSLICCVKVLTPHMLFVVTFQSRSMAERLYANNARLTD